MYGYSFGAAKAGVWHKYDEESMLYPGYMPNGKTRAGWWCILPRPEHHMLCCQGGGLELVGQLRWVQCAGWHRGLTGMLVTCRCSGSLC